MRTFFFVPKTMDYCSLSNNQIVVEVRALWHHLAGGGRKSIVFRRHLPQSRHVRDLIITVAEVRLFLSLARSALSCVVFVAKPRPCACVGCSPCPNIALSQQHLLAREVLRRKPRRVSVISGSAAHRLCTPLEWEMSSASVPLCASSSPLAIA